MLLDNIRATQMGTVPVNNDVRRLDCSVANGRFSRRLEMSVQDQREEVQRILHSPQFRRAPKLQRFLELVCEYHFQNRTDQITEFAIATQAFGKGPNFDPAEDSLVRVQAREIRRRLREYYQNDGKSNCLILDIPIGHYAPAFTSVGAAPREAPPVSVRRTP